MRLNIDRYKGYRRYKSADVIKALEEIGRRLECEWCERKRYIIHHKDCNHNNNDPDNIMLMCKSCHSKCHLLYPNFRYLQRDELLDIIRIAKHVLNERIIIDRIEITQPDNYDKIEEEDNYTYEMVKVDYNKHPLPEI